MLSLSLSLYILYIYIYNIYILGFPSGYSNHLDYSLFINMFAYSH